ncbi:MAG: hypothetical protein WKF71_01225 [Pyrinomonadaceae bacterium]
MNFLKQCRVDDLLPKLNAKQEAALLTAPEWDVAVVRGTYKDFTFGNFQVGDQGRKSSGGRGRNLFSGESQRNAAL